MIRDRFQTDVKSDIIPCGPPVAKLYAHRVCAGMNQFCKRRQIEITNDVSLARDGIDERFDFRAIQEKSEWIKSRPGVVGAGS